MAEMVRRSACRGSKSVDARTISSPTRQPAASRTWIEVLPALAVLASLVQVLLPVPVQVQGAAHEHDPAVNALTRDSRCGNTDVFAFDVVGEGDGRLARVGPGFGADFQFPVHHDPLGGQFEILVVSEAQFAVDRHTAQRRRTDVEDDVPVLLDGDHGVFGGHLLVGPGSWIRPARLLGRRRSFFLGLNDREDADEQEYWERSKKERAIVRTHESTLRTRR